MQFFAMTSEGLEGVLVEELSELGLQKVEKGFMGAFFEGDMRDCMIANICSRIATRILLPIANFKARDPDELYKKIYEIPFENYVSPEGSIVVHGSARGHLWKDQRFVSLKTKDAIVDRFRDQSGVRPNVDKKNPDLVVNVKVVNDEFYVSLDTSGNSLSMRGYRKVTVMAPLREHLGAGLLRMAGAHKDINVVDPMCGSGTFVIEAALAALNHFPGLNQKGFQFQKYKDYDADLWDEVSQKYLDLEAQETTLQFFGSDIDQHAVKAAKTNVFEAGVADFVKIERIGVDALRAPCEKGVVIVNPPYGERLDDENLKDVYRDLGYSLKTNFKGWQCWLLSGNKELVHLMDLKSSLRIPVWNGPIECRLLKYEIRA